MWRQIPALLPCRAAIVLKGRKGSDVALLVGGSCLAEPFEAIRQTAALVDSMAPQARGWGGRYSVPLITRYSNTFSTNVNPWALLAEARKSNRSPGKKVAPARQRRLTEVEVDRIVTRYAELRSLRLVAEEFQIDRSTARSHLRARLVSLEPPASMTHDQVTSAIALYAEGKSSAAIGRALGFSNKTVIKELRAVGVTIRPQVGRRS